MWLVRALALFIVIEWAESASDDQPSIIIVGSGPAGIAAATKLLQNNFNNIKILEAENRIGGRINSVKFGDAFVDLGAEFCHGEENNIVFSMVENLKILQHSKNDGRVFISNGTQMKDDDAEKLIGFADSLFADETPAEGCENSISVGECLDIRVKNISENLAGAKDWATTYLCAYDSPFDLHDLKITSAYQVNKGDLRMHWNGRGYKTILDVMMQKYPNNYAQLPIDSKILLNTSVTAISNWTSSVTVTTAKGTTFKADHVIFTPSVGVLKATHGEMFHPALPQKKVLAIEQTGFGAILKVILRFPSRWWNVDFLSFVWTPQDKEALVQKNLTWLICLGSLAQAENNPKVLIAWYAGKCIPQMERLSEEAIRDGHRYIITKFLASHFDVSMPVEMIKSSWLSNPNFRGTYSYESTESGKGLPRQLGAPLVDENGKPKVLFAGEATHPYYFSTVHGAIESGYREAERLIQLYQTNV
ncbi:spermine oxidase [Dendroctonus ponderosae]|uniref:spermine oxidase n=1 Tax=Dendroctonus ponderosae TaxID=77166 RepID=UPI002035B3E0|nr:spermine oxidase [Dendroctonus ponderosae]